MNCKKFFVEDDNFGYRVFVEVISSLFSFLLLEVYYLTSLNLFGLIRHKRNGQFAFPMCVYEWLTGEEQKTNILLLK